MGLPARFDLSIRTKVCLPLLVVGLVLAVLVNAAMQRTTARVVEQASVTEAASTANSVRLLRAYYAANIVQRASAQGVIFTHDYAGTDGALPLPATMVHELNEQERAGQNLATQRQVRLFSDAPFPWRRETGGLRDAFERDAWAAVNAQPDVPFSRVEDVAGQPAVRYAVADRMVDQTCVDCHNAHPQSPRVDWKVGDVRGVISVSLPIGDRLMAARSDARKTSAVVVFVVAIALLVVAVFVDERLIKPIVMLTRATQAVVAGDVSIQIPVKGSDEVARLAASFNQMIREVEARDDALRFHRLDLERILEERTRSLADRNRVMRGILDNVDQGLVSVAADGRMSAERSATLCEWFGPAAPDEAFSSYIGRTDESAGRWFECAIMQLEDGCLPVDVVIDQLPKRAASKTRTFSLGYRPIVAEGATTQLLVMITDISADVARARAEIEERELLGVLAHVSKDRAGFQDFIEEGDQVIDRLAGADLDALTTNRYIHTLKGNCAMFGAERMAEHCDALETTLEVADAPASLEDLARLCAVWFDFRARIEVIVEKQRPCVEIDIADYEAAMAAMCGETAREDILRRMDSWKLEPTRLSLTRLGAQASTIARRLGKGALRVTIDDQSMRVHKPRWRPFWAALVHVVRNAVDHGLESDDERADAAKAPIRELSLATRLDDGMFVVEIKDDGRGIDWEGVRAQAESRDLPAATHEDLVEALFADGLSTRELADELCGRGVGLAAVRAATRELGGQVSVDTTTGQGTRFRFTFPAAARGAEFNDRVCAVMPVAARAA